MSFITTKLLGYVSGGLGIALVLAGGFGWLQTDRLSSARTTITAQLASIGLLEQRIVADSGKIADRDSLINAQNVAVLALKSASDADHAAYLSRIAAADKVAKVYQTQAANIMARQIDTTDELERSRAALKLIQEMIGQRP